MAHFTSWFSDEACRIGMPIGSCNVPKFSDRQVWADGADPDQTAPDQG